MQIRSGAAILKTWFGCSIPEGSSLADVYVSFSAGQLHHGLPIPEEYQHSAAVVEVGKSTSDLITVSIECSVAEVVSNHGQCPGMPLLCSCNPATHFMPYLKSGK